MGTSKKIYITYMKVFPIYLKKKPKHQSLCTQLYIKALHWSHGLAQAQIKKKKKLFATHGLSTEHTLTLPILAHSET